MGRDAPRRFRVPEPLPPDRSLFALGLFRRVWWPHCGPTLGARGPHAAGLRLGM
jgi:hypothetical protein